MLTYIFIDWNAVKNSYLVLDSIHDSVMFTMNIVNVTNKKQQHILTPNKSHKKFMELFKEHPRNPFFANIASPQEVSNKTFVKICWKRSDP